VLAITPTGAVKDTDDLVVTVTGPNPPDPNEGDTVTYSYRWLVDVGQGIFVDDEFAGRGNHTGNTVPAADTVYGDIWRVEVTPTDNHGAVGPPAVATWRQVGADDPRIDLVSVRYTAPWRGSGRTRTMDYPRRGDRLVFYVAYTRLPSATSPVKVTRVRFTLTNGGYTQQFDGASGSQWSGTWTVPSNAPAGVYTLSCRLDWARTDGTGLTGSDTQFTGVGFPGPSTKQFTLYTAEMKLELVGNIAIDATNSYSENATVRVTAVDPSSGATLTGFSGKVYLAEDGTGIYSQNGGVLPASVDLLGGTTEFVAKSLSEAKVAFRTPPDPAKVKSTNFPVYRPWGPLSPSSLSIAQWVTSGGRVRWCQEWSDALLTAMKGAGGEVGELANKVSEVRVDDWTSNRYGYTTTGSTVVHVNPAAPRHRTNASHELSDTILHESRHIFQAWECEQSPAGAVNNDAGGLNLIDDPNNDDDPGLFSDGDWLPEIVTYASEMNPNGLRDGIDTGTGDGSPDSWSIVVSPAWEGDATEYGQAHRWGF